jgi:hypothetical protein
MSGAERVRRWRIQHGVTTKRSGFTVTVSDEWRSLFAEASENLGVPVNEIADFCLGWGWDGLNSKFQSGLSNRIEWWLVKMHSKYPDTFNVGAWEGSCMNLAIDKLYAARGIPVGKYQEWRAKQDAKEAETANRKAAWFEKMKSNGMGYKMAVDRELKKERQQLEIMESPNGAHGRIYTWLSEEHKTETIALTRQRIQELEEAAAEAAAVVAARKRSAA